MKIIFITLSLLSFLLGVNYGAENIFEIPKLFYFSLVFFLFALYFVKIKTQISLIGNGYFFILLLIYIAIDLLSSFSSIIPELSLFGNYERQMGSLVKISIIVFSYLSISIISDRQLKKVFFILLSISFFLIFYEFYQLIAPNLIVNTQFWGRPIASLGHPNILGITLVIPLFFLLSLLNDKLQHYKLSIIAIIVNILAIILTESRASLIAMIVGLFFFFAVSKLKKHNFCWLISVISICLLILILYFSPLLRHVYEFRNKSIETRLLLWEYSTPLILDHLFLGSGNETFQYRFLPIKPKELNVTENPLLLPDKAHNHIIDTIIENGIGELLVFYLLIIFILFKSLNFSKNNNFLHILLSMMIAIIVYLQFNFFTPVIFYLFFLIYFSALKLLNINLNISTKFIIPFKISILVLATICLFVYSNRMIGDIYFYKAIKTKQINQQLFFYKKALKHYDNNIYRNNYGNLLIYLKQYDLAEINAKKMLKNNLYDYQSSYMMGLVKLGQKDKSTAMFFLKQALDKSKNDLLLCYEITNLNVSNFSCNN